MSYYDLMNVTTTRLFLRNTIYDKTIDIFKQYLHNYFKVLNFEYKEEAKLIKMNILFNKDAMQQLGINDIVASAYRNYLQDKEVLDIVVHNADPNTMVVIQCLINGKGIGYAFNTTITLGENDDEYIVMIEL